MTGYKSALEVQPKGVYKSYCCGDFSPRGAAWHIVNQPLLRNRPGSSSYDLLWLLAWKIMNGIHSCKPALLNHPIEIPFIITTCCNTAASFFCDAAVSWVCFIVFVQVCNIRTCLTCCNTAFFFSEQDQLSPDERDAGEVPGHRPWSHGTRDAVSVCHLSWPPRDPCSEGSVYALWQGEW